MLTKERFLSRGQQLCKFMRTKEIVYIRKESKVWNTNMATVSLFWNTNMAALTSCKNALQIMANKYSFGSCSKHNTIVLVIVFNQ